MTKMKCTWVILSVPSRDEIDEPKWFAYNRETRKSIRATSYTNAESIVNTKNQ